MAAALPSYSSPVAKGFVDPESSLSNLGWLKMMTVHGGPSQPAPQPQRKQLYSFNSSVYKPSQPQILIQDDDDDDLDIPLPPECHDASAAVSRSTTRKKSTNSNLTKDQRELLQKFALASLEQHSTNASERPPYAYATIIYMAMKTSGRKCMQIADIYSKIMSQWSYYKQRKEETGWKNSIRHNLTVGRCFKKVSREETDGKGGFWEIDEQIATREISFIPRDLSPKLKKKMKEKQKRQLAHSRAGKVGPPSKGKYSPLCRASSPERNLEAKSTTPNQTPSQTPTPKMEDPMMMDVDAQEELDLGNLAPILLMADNHTLADSMHSQRSVVPFADGFASPLNRSLTGSFNLGCSFMARSFSAALGQSFGLSMGNSQSFSSILAEIKKEQRSN